MATPSGSQLQAKFFTKQTQFSVADVPFSIPATVESKELNSLINRLISDTINKEGDAKLIEFDFLINGEFLRVQLLQFLEEREISTETVVDIEYVEKHPAPKPEDSLTHDDWVSCLHGSGQHIVSGCYDNTVRLWSSSGSSIMTIPGHSAPVKCVSWINGEEPVCSFVSGSHDQTLHIWKWNKKSNEIDCTHACRGHAGSVDCVAVNTTRQRFCSGSWDKMLKIWSAVIYQDEELEDVDDTPPTKKKKTSAAKVQTRVPIVTLSGHNEGISSCLWMDSSEICTASWDHTIKLWDIEHASEKSSLQGNKVFLDVSYSSLNRMLITGSADRHVRLWDPRVSEGTIVKCTFTSHTGWVSGVAWSPIKDNQFISGSYDMVMKLWDTRSPKAPLYNMSGHEDKILAVDWSIPELLLSAGADHHLKLFQYQNPQ